MHDLEDYTPSVIRVRETINESKGKRKLSTMSFVVDVCAIKHCGVTDHDDTNQF